MHTPWTALLSESSPPGKHDPARQFAKSFSVDSARADGAGLAAALRAAVS